MAKRGRPPKHRIGDDRPLFHDECDPYQSRGVPSPGTFDGKSPPPTPRVSVSPAPNKSAALALPKRLLGATDVGDRFEDDAEIILYPGETSDFLKTIPLGSVKLVITSPPYNIGKQYETKAAIDHYLEEQDRILDDLHRVLSPDGNLCWQVGNTVKDGEIFPWISISTPCSSGGASGSGTGSSGTSRTVCTPRKNFLPVASLCAVWRRSGDLLATSRDLPGG